MVFAGASLIARQEAKAWAIWEDKARQRASRTSRSLSQIQNFKTIGLQDIVSNYIDGLHTTEMAYYLKARLLTMWRLLFCKLLLTLENISLTTSSWYDLDLHSNHSNSGMLFLCLLRRCTEPK